MTGYCDSCGETGGHEIGCELAAKLPSRFQIGDVVRYENSRAIVAGVTFLPDKVLYDLGTKHGLLMRTPSEFVSESFECIGTGEHK